MSEPKCSVCDATPGKLFEVDGVLYCLFDLPDRAFGIARQTVDEYDQQAAQIAALETENARLRAGLIEIQRRVTEYVARDGATQRELRQLYARAAFTLSGALGNEEPGS